MARPKRKSHRSFWLTTLILVVLVIGSGAYYYQTTVRQAGAKATAAAAIKTAQVKKGDITITATGTPKLVPVAEVGLAFRSGGQVVEVLVKEGDTVKTGQVLASLDTSDLKLTAQQQYANYIYAQAAYSATIRGPSAVDLASAQAALDAAQVAYSETVKGASAADIASAKAALNSAVQAYNDLLKPPDPNSVANLKATLDNAKAALDQAQAAYDAAYSRNPASISATPQALALQQATNNYIAAKANYDKAFEKPADSTIANVQAQIVAAQAKLDALTPTDQATAQAASSVAAAQAKLAALTPTPETILQAKAKMDQAYIAWQQAEKVVTDATLKAPFYGLVASVAVVPGSSVNSSLAAVTLLDLSKSWVQIAIDETDARQVALGYAVDVTFDAWPDQIFPGTIVQVDATVVLVNGISTLYATAELKTPAPFLKVGMSGSAKITAAAAKQVLTVPVEAVHEISPGQYAVFVVDEAQQLTLRSVEIGLKGTSLVEIKSGLQPGETVSTGTVATK